MLQTGICRFLSLFLTCILLASLYSCSTSKKASPNAIFDVEYNELDYEFIQKTDEELIEFLIFFSKERGYDQFQQELRRLNLLVPTHFREVSYLEGELALNTYGEKVTNGVMIVKSENNFEVFFNMLESFGIPFSTELFESNGLYFEKSEPKLIGGLQGLHNQIIYPENARKANIQGRVIVKFVVTEKGEVINAEVVQRVHRTVNKEALRAVKNSKFVPGINNGKPVKTQYSLPVNFSLR